MRLANDRDQVLTGIAYGIYREIPATVPGALDTAPMTFRINSIEFELDDGRPFVLISQSPLRIRVQGRNYEEFAREALAED